MTANTFAINFRGASVLPGAADCGRESLHENTREIAARVDAISARSAAIMRFIRRAKIATFVGVEIRSLRGGSASSFPLFSRFEVVVKKCSADPARILNVAVRMYRCILYLLKKSFVLRGIYGNSIRASTEKFSFY